MVYTIIGSLTDFQVRIYSCEPLSESDQCMYVPKLN